MKDYNEVLLENANLDIAFLKYLIEEAEENEEGGSDSSKSKEDEYVTRTGVGTRVHLAAKKIKKIFDTIMDYIREFISKIKNFFRKIKEMKEIKNFKTFTFEGAYVDTKKLDKMMNGLEKLMDEKPEHSSVSVSLDGKRLSAESKKNMWGHYASKCEINDVTDKKSFKTKATEYVMIKKDTKTTFSSYQEVADTCISYDVIDKLNSMKRTMKSNYKEAIRELKRAVDGESGKLDVATIEEKFNIILVMAGVIISLGNASIKRGYKIYKKAQYHAEKNVRLKTQTNATSESANQFSVDLDLLLMESELLF